jgi:serine/threonine protein kinase
VPKEFEFKELRKGTGNFDERMKLGQGGYGVVYRATVPGDNGQSMEVAVKQFSGANTKGQEDFLAELSIINRLRHRNLVKLVGKCSRALFFTYRSF